MIGLLWANKWYNLILNRILYHKKHCPPSFKEVGSVSLVANIVVTKKYMKKYVELLILETLLKTKMRH